MAQLVRKLLTSVFILSLLLPAAVFADAGVPNLGAGFAGKMNLHVKGDNLFGRAEVVSVSDSGLTVKGNDDVEYTLLVNEDSKLRYRGGKALLRDFLTGDRVVLKAKTDEAGNYVVRHLMNVSLRRAAIHGKVANLLDMNFDVQTEKRGTFAVTVSDSTEFRFDNEEHAPGSLADLHNDMEITVKGRLHMPTMSMDQVKFVVMHNEE